MLSRFLTLLLIGSLYLPTFVQAFGSYDLQHAVHTATEKYVEQSSHNAHHDEADVTVTVKAEQTDDQVTDFIILPLLSESHEYLRAVITRVKGVAVCDDCDDNGNNSNDSNDSDNHSTAVLTDYAYGRAFSPPLVAVNPLLFYSRFSQRDIYLQTHRLRI